MSNRIPSFNEYVMNEQGLGLIDYSFSFFDRFIVSLDQYPSIRKRIELDVDLVEDKNEIGIKNITKVYLKVRADMIDRYSTVRVPVVYYAERGLVGIHMNEINEADQLKYYVIGFITSALMTAQKICSLIKKYNSI